MGAGKRAWLAVLVVLFAACAGSSPENKPVTRENVPPAAVPVARTDAAMASAAVGDRAVILFLGTSLTAGLGLDPDSAYPARIQRKIDSAGMSFDAVNAGVSGETSAGLLRRLDWVLKRPAAVIVVETGANDGLRGQPVSSTRATIGKVLDRIAKEQPGARVSLVQMEAPPNLGASYTSAFHAMYPALAREHGVTLLPFLLDGVAGFPSLNQADGMHPNNRGEAIVAENVWRGLEQELRRSGGQAVRNEAPRHPDVLP
jgi:acyl-CoA thioesterase-1